MANAFHLHFLGKPVGKLPAEVLWGRAGQKLDATRHYFSACYPVFDAAQLATNLLSMY
jgi:hypothetical protein